MTKPNNYRIAGLKFTHDGGVAVIENGRLLFSYEMEKLDNAPRYSTMADPAAIERILRLEGIEPETIDMWSIDGWKYGRVKQRHELAVAGYHEGDVGGGKREGGWFYLGGRQRPFRFASNTHNAGHIFSGYCSSPFAKRREPAYVLVFDGGQGARLYSVDPNSMSNKTDAYKLVMPLHDMGGILYGIMGYYFGPYARPDVQLEMARTILDQKAPADYPVYFGGYETPGKLMAYLAKGTPRTHAWMALDESYARVGGKILSGARLRFEQNGAMEHQLMSLLSGWRESQLGGAERSSGEARDRRLAELELTDADMLATIHAWLGDLTLSTLRRAVPRGSNLVFVGGSALNIKWNTQLRDSGHFAEVWVPPFPNDSGSAIGAACAEMVLATGRWDLDWSVYSGPRLGAYDGMNPAVPLPRGWEASYCSLETLADVLYAGSPVVFLSGRAEIGPRALGARSILGAASSAEMKGLMNEMKGREEWRPVSPVCLESDAPAYFDPGTPDDYMLFEHRARRDADVSIPSAFHLDGTARLQTVPDNGIGMSDIHQLLWHFRELCAMRGGPGMLDLAPVLCNTSANFNGSGFFPDAESAMRWGKCRRVWADGVLYTNVGTVD